MQVKLKATVVCDPVREKVYQSPPHSRKVHLVHRGGSGRKGRDKRWGLWGTPTHCNKSTTLEQSVELKKFNKRDVHLESFICAFNCTWITEVAKGEKEGAQYSPPKGTSSGPSDRRRQNQFRVGLVSKLTHK